VHPKVVSERLGHSTVGITLDTYSHVVQGLDAEAAATVAKKLFSRRELAEREATATATAAKKPAPRPL
jgi:integrase